MGDGLGILAIVAVGLSKELYARKINPFLNQRDIMSNIYQTASSICSTKCESFMVQSQRNTVTNGIAERNTGAPFIALNFPLNSAVRACKSLALATDLTDYLMESGVVDLPYRRVADGQRFRPLHMIYL